jgi:hypothetical protein
MVVKPKQEKRHESVSKTNAKSTVQFSTGDVSFDAAGKVIASNLKPVDVRSLSLKEQCLLEVLQEQSAKCSHGESFTITADMVDARMQEKLSRKKRGR